MESAEKAYEAVLAKAGATLPQRDTMDERIVDATRNQKSYYLPIEVQQIDFYPFTFVAGRRLLRPRGNAG